MSHYAEAWWRLPGDIVFHTLKGEAELWNGALESGFVVAPFSGNARIIKGIWTTNSCQTPQTGRFNAGYRNENKSEYIDGVRGLLDFMKLDHALSKVVLSTTRNFLCNDFNPQFAFHLLCAAYPDAAVSLIFIENAWWLAASPELLLRAQGNQIRTMSLAGTRAQSDEMPFMAKEYEEQKLVTDYISEVFSKAKCSDIELMGPYVREAGNLKHLCSDLNAHFNGNLYDLLLELHPTPAVGGLPNNKSLETIANLESFDRDLFGGYWGMLDDTQAQFYVHIRCLKFADNQCTQFAGAGITSASNPLAEWLEIQHKMDTLFSVLFA